MLPGSLATALPGVETFLPEMGEPSVQTMVLKRHRSLTGNSFRPVQSVELGDELWSLVDHSMTEKDHTTMDQFAIGVHQQLGSLPLHDSTNPRPPRRGAVVVGLAASRLVRRTARASRLVRQGGRETLLRGRRPPKRTWRLVG